MNMLNDMGDTPLHRAAFTGRKVKDLLRFALQVRWLGEQSLPSGQSLPLSSSWEPLAHVESALGRRAHGSELHREVDHKGRSLAFPD